MNYIALLRGINVGGNSKVSMAVLKETFASLGFSQIKTYINSGNVLFQTDNTESAALEKLLEAKILEDFGLPVSVIVYSEQQFRRIASALKDTWLNNADMKCDVMYLWQEIDNDQILKTLGHNPDIETMIHVPGAVIWCIDRKLVTKSKMLRIIGTQTYKKMTVRNCNTVRKLCALLDEQNSSSS